jgi:hypothetical protein
MNKAILTLLLLFQALVYSQTRIKGKVITYKKTPLEGAAVYLNNTSIGTYTNAEGEFEFIPRKGVYTLIVSYVGFKTITYSLDTGMYNKPLVFVLRPEANLLDEIVVSSKKSKKNIAKKKRLRGKDRTYFKRFKNAFIGKTRFSSDCRILNPEVLDFTYYKKTKTLSVKASAPLKIKNDALGYFIDYDLEYFNLERTKVSYLGYSRFSEIEAKTEKKKSKWRENRIRSYKGSKQHFLKSLISRDLKNEGFSVDLVERVPNPKRATPEEIKKANMYISEQKFRNVYVDFKKEIVAPTTKLDSAIIMVNSSKLPTHITKLIKRDIPVKRLLFYNNSVYNLRFDNYLRIRYHKEGEEKSYLPNRKRLNYQESIIGLSYGSTIVNLNGTFQNPLDVYVTGYWAFEQFGDELPLDYELPKD